MSVSSDNYEALVEQLAGRIARSRRINLRGQPLYGRSNKMLGASGVKHQIDVSVEYNSKDGAHRLKLVECKLRSKEKIGLGVVAAFHARMLDIQNRLGDKTRVEGNLFTTVGYTSGARRYADFYRIATNSLQEDEEAWSFSFADHIVIGLRPLKLSAAARKTGISNKP